MQHNRHLKGAICHVLGTAPKPVAVLTVSRCSWKLVLPLSSNSLVDYLALGTWLDHSSKQKFLLYQKYIHYIYAFATSNTTPQSEPFAVEAVVAGTTTTSGSVENCLTWCTKSFGCSLCSISDGGVSFSFWFMEGFHRSPFKFSLLLIKLFKVCGKYYSKCLVGIVTNVSPQSVAITYRLQE